MRFPRWSDSRAVPPNEWPTAPPGVTHHQLVRSYWISKAQKPAESLRRDLVWDQIQARPRRDKRKEVYFQFGQVQSPGYCREHDDPLGQEEHAEPGGFLLWQDFLGFSHLFDTFARECSFPQGHNCKCTGLQTIGLPC